MQRYRPDIAWPRVGDPWPMMAEDSELGQYYAKEDVDLEIDRLNKKCAALARLVYPTHPDPTGKSREPPHCPSCSCGMPTVLDQSEPDPEANRVLYENLSKLQKT